MNRREIEEWLESACPMAADDTAVLQPLTLDEVAALDQARDEYLDWVARHFDLIQRIPGLELAALTMEYDPNAGHIDELREWRRRGDAAQGIGDPALVAEELARRAWDESEEEERWEAALREVFGEDEGEDKCEQADS